MKNWLTSQWARAASTLRQETGPRRPTPTGIVWHQEVIAEVRTLAETVAA